MVEHFHCVVTCAEGVGFVVTVTVLADVQPPLAVTVYFRVMVPRPKPGDVLKVTVAVLAFTRLFASVAPVPSALMIVHACVNGAEPEGVAVNITIFGPPKVVP